MDQVTHPGMLSSGNSPTPLCFLESRALSSSCRCSRPDIGAARLSINAGAAVAAAPTVARSTAATKAPAAAAVLIVGWGSKCNGGGRVGL